MPKNVAKSIRMSEEVNDYITNYRGNGFNEKFENIILDAMKTEADKVKILETLDKRIEVNKAKLQELCDMFEKLNPHLQVALRINTMVNDLRIKLEDV